MGTTVYKVLLEGAKKPNPPAYAVVDKKTRLIRMDPKSKALAIFDTRAAARALVKLHRGATFVVKITMERAKGVPTV